MQFDMSVEHEVSRPNYVYPFPYTTETDEFEWLNTNPLLEGTNAALVEKMKTMPQDTLDDLLLQDVKGTRPISDKHVQRVAQREFVMRGDTWIDDARTMAQNIQWRKELSVLGAHGLAEILIQKLRSGGCYDLQSWKDWMYLKTHGYEGQKLSLLVRECAKTELNVSFCMEIAQTHRRMNKQCNVM
jgi:hypothetical protein